MNTVKVPFDQETCKIDVPVLFVVFTGKWTIYFYYCTGRIYSYGSFKKVHIITSFSRTNNEISGNLIVRKCLARIQKKIPTRHICLTEFFCLDITIRIFDQDLEGFLDNVLELY
jgi:hypothetical protein